MNKVNKRDYACISPCQSYFEIYNNKLQKKCNCLNLLKRVQRNRQDIIYFNVNGLCVAYDLLRHGGVIMSF